MDSSSNDSFAWSHVSNNSEDSEFDSPMTDHSKKPILNNEDKEEAPNNNNEHLSPEKKIKKRKLTLEPPDSENSIDSPKKKKIELEENEDIYVKKKKKKKKHKHNSCDTLDHSEDNILEDYDYLNMKVKQEQDNGKKEYVSKAKKYKKSFSETEENHSLNDTDFSEKKIKIKNKHILESDSFLSDEEKPAASPKKRKNKKRKETTPDESKEDNVIIEDKFSAEETIVFNNSCDTLNHSEDNILEDYDYLNMKVKQEQDNCKKENVSKAKKYKKSFSETEENNSLNDTDFSEKKEKKIKIKDKHILETDSLLSDEEKPAASPKKRKNKKRKETTPDESNDENFIIEDKFSAEETIVQKIPAHPTSYDNGELRDMARNNKVNATDNTDSCSDDDSKSHNITENDHNNTKIEQENINSPKIKEKKNSPKIKDKNDKHNSTSGNSKSTNSVSEQSHATPRISDKIIFDDESDLDTEKTPICTDKESYSSGLKRYLKGKPSLQPVLKKMQKSQKITDNDELWILKCPHELDVVDFRSKDFILDSKSKIKINGETFIGNLDEDIGRVTVMTTEKEEFLIKNLKVNGVITLRKRLPKPHVVEHMMTNYQTDFIPLPETKCRHPLFGSNYKSSLKIPSPIAQRLINDENISSSVNYNKKKNKKEPNGDLDDNIDIKPKTEVDGPTKKAKKRKHDHNSEKLIKKAKKIKQEPDSSDVWESEKAIEENLFNF